MTDGNEMAFAGVEYAWRDGVAEVAGQHFGLTKREYFASMAMQGLLASPDSPQWTSEKIAKYAVEHADYLIAALNKKDT